ncbi:ROK family protein [Ancylomarina euxinus]|uniref:ROK family protein n=1 Tax=Ancylomarina euxinus TaxID=2283627 RepID=A0A425Y6G2_9BACT|nr:ROK family protein [Ancylomarina euxinus]MCZ4694032.1 ROK family protein [Ancylomarina euxinus]MUP14548.1 ROK family protein [Ancylomarina euxinus]RRG24097.1 ROK family protein [Ancylomarina euxinus]
MKDITIGIDIGGTNTVFGFIDSNGKSWGEGTIPTQTRERFEDYLKDLFKAIDQTIRNSKEDLRVIGVGIGAPNGNYRTGTIDNAANLRWKGNLDLAKLIGEELKVPVKVTNDANAAALGERIFGGAKDMSDFMVITLGTGLGSGIVVNGDLLYGHDGFAGEVGHIIVRPGGRECGCGRRGCLETYVSATGVKRTAYKMLAKHLGESSLRDVPFNGLTAKMVADAANKGDLLAIEIFAYTGRMLGEALANVASVTSPKAIFFFGGLAKAGDLLFDPVREAMEKNILFLYKDKISLQASELGDDAAVLGASALIWNDKA